MKSAEGRRSEVAEQEPELEVLAVTRDDAALTVAHAGPRESWEFGPLVQEVLALSAQGSASASGDVGLRIICIGRYSDTTPGFRLTRLLIGQLIALNSSVELRLEHRQGRVPLSQGESGSLPRLRAEFSLQTHRDYDPQKISDSIDLPPSHQVRKGELQKMGGLRSASTRWTLSLPEQRADSFDLALDELLSRLEPRSASIASLIRDELDGVLSLVGYFSMSSPIVRLGMDELRRVRALGVEIDVDLMAASSPEPGDR